MRRIFTQLVSEDCFIILIPLYCKFTVVNWLNDCKDMKLVVPTLVILFYLYQSIVALLVYIEHYSVKKFIIPSALPTLRIKQVEHFQTNSRRMDIFNFGYSTNIIPIATERQYKLKLVEMIEVVIKRMRWKAFYSEHSETGNNSKNIYYGLTSYKKHHLLRQQKKIERSTVNSKINLTQI